MKVCHWCEGSGIVGRHMDYEDVCPRCDGRGMVTDPFEVRRWLRELQRRVLVSMRYRPGMLLIPRVRMRTYERRFGHVIKGRRRT